ncbi:MAG: hypothetical protein M0Q95_08610 [Porticoccaceae bacterium]|nr:hypothetical protein [Porticoccaceae bacterium]
MSDENLLSARKNLESRALEVLFSSFAERRIRYAVLRNFEHLPKSIGARDIDIVIFPEDLSSACAVVFTLAEQMGFQCASYFRDERLTQFTLVRRTSEVGIFDLKIDFFTNSQVYGVEILSAERMIEDHKLHNGIPVVSDSVLLLDKWLFHLIVGRPLNQKYDLLFSKISRQENDEIFSALQPVFGRSVALTLLGSLADGRGSSSPPLARGQRFRALFKLWRSQGIVAGLRSIKFLLYRLKDRARPRGVFLSISGPDGSGKTTVIDKVIMQLRQIYGDSNVRYGHFRPEALPRIAEVAKAARIVETVDEQYDRPHRAQPSGLTMSLLRFFYYWLDYLVGYLRMVHSALVRREVVLFDRYVYDMVCDPGRSRIALPGWLIRSSIRFLPLPKWAFFIRVSADEVYRRKQELDLDTIRELNSHYEELVVRELLISVDNNDRPDVAAAQIVDIIVRDRDIAVRRSLSRFLP